MRAVNAHEEIDVNGFAIPVALIRYDGGAHKKAAAAAVSDLNRRMMKYVLDLVRVHIYFLLGAIQISHFVESPL